MQLTGLAPANTALPVPAPLRAQLDAAVAGGREEAAGWARIHPTGSTNRFRGDALERLAPPPTGDAADADLQAVRDAKAMRTSDGIERAKQLAARAGWETWESVIAEIGRTEGRDQAEHAARLVQLAAARTDEISGQAKRSWNRRRPYELDPSIAPVVTKPHGNAGYPSGHTSGAYAAALVLAELVPAKADLLLDVAAQVAWSRVYGGVHFPSDVLAGARIASAVASDVLRRDAAGLPPR